MSSIDSSAFLSNRGPSAGDRHIRGESSDALLSAPAPIVAVSRRLADTALAGIAASARELGDAVARDLARQFGEHR